MNDPSLEEGLFFSQIDCGSSEEFCVTWLNDMDISDNLTSVNDSYYSGNAEVVRESVTTVAVGLANGISLAVTYNQSIGIPSFQLNLDPGLSGTMVGLLGNKAGKLVYRNGVPFNLTAASDQEIFDFGNNCELTTIAFHFSKTPFLFILRVCQIFFFSLFSLNNHTHTIFLLPLKQIFFPPRADS